MTNLRHTLTSSSSRFRRFAEAQTTSSTSPTDSASSKSLPETLRLLASELNLTFCDEGDGLYTIENSTMFLQVDTSSNSVEQDQSDDLRRTDEWEKSINSHLQAIMKSGDTKMLSTSLYSLAHRSALVCRRKRKRKATELETIVPFKTMETFADRVFRSMKSKVLETFRTVAGPRLSYFRQNYFLQCRLQSDGFEFVLEPPVWMTPVTATLITNIFPTSEASKSSETVPPVKDKRKLVQLEIVERKELEQIALASSLVEGICDFCSPSNSLHLESVCLSAITKKPLNLCEMLGTSLATQNIEDSAKFPEKALTECREKVEEALGRLRQQIYVNNVLIAWSKRERKEKGNNPLLSEKQTSKKVTPFISGEKLSFFIQVKGGKIEEWILSFSFPKVSMKTDWSSAHIEVGPKGAFGKKIYTYRPNNDVCSLLEECSAEAFSKFIDVSLERYK
eukprot:g4228.t1